MLQLMTWANHVPLQHSVGFFRIRSHLARSETELLDLYTCKFVSQDYFAANLGIRYDFLASTMQLSVKSENYLRHCLKLFLVKDSDQIAGDLGCFASHKERTG
ncbi:unnamed protein product [Durusdinium trenchii]|uniref:Uncharacterized protein n=1 Tax=Durusdinium trenchii TaxID=1381693 RepID=A0ABP0NS61_9DINO